MIKRLSSLPHRRRLLLVFWALNAAIAGGLLIFALR